MKSLLKKAPSFSTKKGKDAKSKSSATQNNQQQQPAVEEPNSSPAATEESESRTDSRENETTTSSYRSLAPLQLGSFNFDIADPTTNKHVTPYIYPSLYDEASTMIDLSNLIYTLVELRELARNGVLTDPSKSLRILDLPLPLETAVSVIKNEAGLLREVLNDKEHGSTLSALESLSLKEQQAKDKKKTDESNNDSGTSNKEDNGLSSWFNSWDGCLGGGFSFDELMDNVCGDLNNVMGNSNEEEASATHNKHPNVQSTMIYHVGDVNSNEELVYAIGVNPAEERITVCFRGSVTKSDFMTDANIALTQAPDPYSVGDDCNGGSNTGSIGIHKGFYDYLFGQKNGKPSKYVEIMTHVEKLVIEDPNLRQNYKLYVTGHSLGGALATLFGFYAAATVGTLPLPVTVVSVASPKVGNIEFARMFAQMESQGKIRHLRIANHRDPVTLGPSVSAKKSLAVTAMAFSPLGYLALKASGNLGDERDVFYHTGIKMKLRKDEPIGGQRCEISYSGSSLITGSSPKALEAGDKEVIEENNKMKKRSVNDVPMVQYHYGSAYAERIALVENELKELKLNDLYLEKAKWSSP